MSHAKRLLATDVAVIILFVRPVHNTERRVSSAPLIDVRRCVDSDGHLDLYDTSYSAELGVPACLEFGRCPAGAVSVRQQCVQEAASGINVLEATLTIRASCDSTCGRDRGIGIASSFWLSFARLLGVPLHESAAAVFLLSPHLLHYCPLEHLTLTYPNASSQLLSQMHKGINDRQGLYWHDGRNDGHPAEANEWDIFVAFRVRTSRLVPNDLKPLLNGGAEAITNLLRVSGVSSLQIGSFAFQESLEADTPHIQLLVPSFKFFNQDWDSQPGRQCEQAAADGKGLNQWPVLRGNHWTSALADTRLTTLFTIAPFRHPLRFVASEPGGLAGTWYVDEYVQETTGQQFFDEDSALTEIIIGILGLLCILFCFIWILRRMMLKADMDDEGKRNNVGSSFNPAKLRKQSKVRPEIIPGEPEEEPEGNHTSPSSSGAKSQESTPTSFGARRYTQAQNLPTGPDIEHEGWRSRPHPDEAPPLRGRSRVSSSQHSHFRRHNSHPPTAGNNSQGKDTNTHCNIRGQRASDSPANLLSPAAQALIANMMQRLDAAWGAPLEERKRVFRDLQRDLHPDKNMDSEADAQAAKVAFQRLMERRAGFLLVG